MSFKFILLALCCMLLSSCAVLQDKFLVCYVVLEGHDVYDTGTAVFLPSNAPSITQRYKPAIIGRSGEPVPGSHDGIDIIGKKGLPVIAPANGYVSASFWDPLYGNRLEIDHGSDVNGLHTVTRYFHLDKRLVKKGEQVQRGQKIAALGQTGLLAPNLHLHFEIHESLPLNDRRSLSTLNPHLFWWNGAGLVTCFDQAQDYSSSIFKMTYPLPCQPKL